jgi:hypothetical protein
MEVSYYNSKTGESVDATNEVLNKNIKELKNSYLNKIKKYLTDNNIPFRNSFYGIQ